MRGTESIITVSLAKATRGSDSGESPTLPPSARQGGPNLDSGKRKRKKKKWRVKGQDAIKWQKLLSPATRKDRGVKALNSKFQEKEERMKGGTPQSLAKVIHSPGAGAKTDTIESEGGTDFESEKHRKREEKVPGDAVGTGITLSTTQGLHRADYSRERARRRNKKILQKKKEKKKKNKEKKKKRKKTTNKQKQYNHSQNPSHELLREKSPKMILNPWTLVEIYTVYILRNRSYFWVEERRGPSPATNL